ncbi:penicillin acylase family protein [Marinovum sp. 2_MG-2023]|uniref:penicillin acylase family protein n=1 Tax=unclassified Marinovum TaxID=2647166 RepID=UPI0026E44934|nr:MULTISPECIES: penicillin acylase family protein [unclassified Marinovum]MDO6731936.1 penicillin acylase family protein [Marinovum sp. 2_MG-2023]MDO6781188.1 penicillin acylase family protein [Marinovum sp. 1_MG-2023]
MASVFKWLFRLATTLVILVTLAVVVVYYLASRSLPDYDKTVSVRGTAGAVEIVRNNANVPHIFADTDPDVFFGLGYAHAQDRLWQMVVLRRTAQGRLSEVFGRRTLNTDTLLRRLDLYPLAVKSLAAQDARTLTALQSYSAGVNARLAEVNENALGRGAPEFFVFNAPIAPWQPADSIALVKLLAVQLSGHLPEEVLRARTSLLVRDEARLADILPDAPGAGVAALPEYASLVPEITQSAPRYAQSNTPTPSRDLLSPFAPRGLAGASNAWAAAPNRSASGGTLLANDPHLGFSAPSIWYLARMDLASGGVIGGTIPGVPLVLAGKSPNIGWGITSSYLDDQDLFIEQLNPDNPQQYRTPGGFKDFETRRSIVQIKDEAPVTLTLRWTDNGPVLPGSHYNLGEVTPAGHVAALSWTALADRDTTLSAGVALMYAQTLEDARAAGEAYVAPSQMLTLADSDGIAMQLIGHMPRRSERHESKGRMPTRGWIVDNRWQGVLPYEDNPSFLRPEGGIVGNTNNKMIDRPFPEHVSYSWGDSQRIQRWQRLMQGREVHTRDSFTEAQLDTVSITARSLLPLIGADLWFTGEAAPEGTIARQRETALALLANWTGEMNEHLPEPLIYAAWLRALQDRLIRDDIGPLADEFDHVEPLFIERVYRDVDGASAWCDILQSSPTETCVDIARLALEDAIVWLEENFGRDLSALRWGDAHQATHDHPVLGEVPVLRYFVNIRQSTSGGDHTLLRGRTSGRGPNPYQNVHGAGYRGVYDFADPDSSVFVTSTGQSGHFLSRHYDDLGSLWRRGEYIPMSLDEELARAAATGITRLVPRP